MKVYLVIAGYEYDGAAVVSAHSTRELAEIEYHNALVSEMYFDSVKIIGMEVDA